MTAPLLEKGSWGELINLDLIRSADASVGVGTGADGALLCRAVDGDESEAEEESLVPFEIIEE